MSDRPPNDLDAAWAAECNARANRIDAIYNVAFSVLRADLAMADKRYAELLATCRNAS